MNVSIKCINLIKHFEGCKLIAYKCPAGIPTIGYGNTYYKDGSKVKLGDQITQEQADELLLIILEDFIESVQHLVKAPINQNQFDSLVSFVYNVGSGNFQKSTLLKKVNLNPADASINLEFMKWNKAKGIVLKGLTRRRQAESDLYFTN